MLWAIHQRFDCALKTLDTFCSLSLFSQYIVHNKFFIVESLYIQLLRVTDSSFEPSRF